MKHLVLIATSFAISACATSSPESSPPEIAQATEAVQATDTVQAMESGSGELLAHDSQVQSTQGIEQIEAPSVSETPAAMIPHTAKVEPAVICKRETPTGSRIPVRVCRSRAENEDRENADQKMLRDWQNKASIGVNW